MPIQGNIPRCQYIKVDGRRCGSPSLKTKRWCYFHYEVNRPTYSLDIPPLEDGDAVQLALTDLARAVADSRVDLKQAALLAYILQTASANLKSVHLGCHTADMVRDLPPIDAYTRGPSMQDPSEGTNAALPSEGPDFNRAKKLEAENSSTLPKAGLPSSAPSAEKSSASGACPERSRGALQAPDSPGSEHSSEPSVSSVVKRGSASSAFEASDLPGGKGFLRVSVPPR